MIPARTCESSDRTADMGRSGTTPRSLHLGMGWFPDQPGGLNRYVRELVGALETAGAETTTVVVGPASDPGPTVTVAGRAGSPLPARLLEFARAARRQADPQIIDIHFGLYAALPTRLRPLRRLPSVLHFHGPWDLEGVASGDGALTASAKRMVERFAYRRADEAVVLSRAFRRQLVERYGFSPWRVNVIPPGVDLNRFSPGDRGTARARARAAEGRLDRAGTSSTRPSNGRRRSRLGLEPTRARRWTSARRRRRAGSWGTRAPGVRDGSVSRPGRRRFAAGLLPRGRSLRRPVAVARRLRARGARGPGVRDARDRHRRRRPTGGASRAWRRPAGAGR